MSDKNGNGVDAIEVQTIEVLPPEPIKRRGPGRPKGSKTKKRGPLARRLQKLGFDPVKTLVDFAKDPEETKEFRYQCAIELLPYCYPKLRSQEIRIDQTEPFVFHFIATQDD